MNSHVGGVFSDTSGPTLGNSSQANTTVDRTGTAYRATEEKFSTRDTETPGNRQFDEYTTTTKSKHDGDYSGVAALENGRVTSASGKDKADQFGRVETKGNSFREASDSDTDNGVTTTTYSASGGNNTSRGEQTSTGTSWGSEERSTGEASANQSGQTRGQGTSVESKVVEGEDHRRSETVVSSAKRNGRAEKENTSEGKVSTGTAGTDGKFDVTSSTKGNDEYQTTRTIDDSSANSRSRSTVTRTDKPSVDLETKGKVEVTAGAVRPTSESIGGTRANEAKVEFNSRGNRQQYAAGGTRFAYEHSDGTLDNSTNVTFGDEQGELQNIADLHAKLVEVDKENTKNVEGWFSPGDGTTPNFREGEKITRTVDGKITTHTSRLDPNDPASAKARLSGRRTDTVTIEYKKDKISEDNGTTTIDKVDNTTTSTIERSALASLASVTDTHTVTWDNYSLDEVRTTSETNYDLSLRYLPGTTTEIPVTATTTSRQFNEVKDDGSWKQVTASEKDGAQVSLDIISWQNVMETHPGGEEDFTEFTKIIQGQDYYIREVYYDQQRVTKRDSSTYHSEHDVISGLAVNGRFSTTSSTWTKTDDYVGHEQHLDAFYETYYEELFRQKLTYVERGDGNLDTYEVIEWTTSRSESGSYRDNPATGRREMIGEFSGIDSVLRSSPRYLYEYDFQDLDRLESSLGYDIKSESETTVDVTKSKLESEDHRGSYSPQHFKQTTKTTNRVRDLQYNHQLRDYQNHEQSGTLVYGINSEVKDRSREEKSRVLDPSEGTITEEEIQTGSYWGEVTWDKLRVHPETFYWFTLVATAYEPGTYPFAEQYWDTSSKTVTPIETPKIREEKGPQNYGRLDPTVADRSRAANTSIGTNIVPESMAGAVRAGEDANLGYFDRLASDPSSKRALERELGLGPSDNARAAADQLARNTAIGLETGLSMLPGATLYEVGNLTHGQNLRGDPATVGDAAGTAASTASVFFWFFRVRKADEVLEEADEAVEASETLSKNADEAKGFAAPVSGPGQFGRVIESMSDRAARYQSRITGRLPDVGYIVKGVKFDGFDETAGVLLDAKGPGYANLVRNGRFQPWFRGADGLVKQARHQLGAAGGTRIQWHFAEEAAAEATRNLFKREGITGIDVIFTP